jgi:hypothetical protein
LIASHGDERSVLGVVPENVIDDRPDGNDIGVTGHMTHERMSDVMTHGT